tara:strand:+ start:41 stop:430 length:390 start_codon:yes stop_codon:yes gene_type:complete
MQEYRGLIFRYAINFIALACVSLLLGCYSVGEIKGQTTGAQVNLSGKNYKVIKAGAMGSSSGFMLLGIPFSGPTYAEAKQELYSSIGQEVEGRSVALVNQTEDRELSNFIFFQLPKLTLTADVIEFLEQ